MKKSNLLKHLQKIIATIIIAIMMSVYFPIIHNVALAVESDKTEVTIKDANLKKYLLEYHDYDSDKIITNSDISQIKDFQVNSSVRDLSGLEGATNIESLRIYTSNCANLDMLYNLPKLKSLSLEYGDSESLLTYFKSLNKLETLIIGGNQENINYSIISNLANLKELSLRNSYNPYQAGNIDLNVFSKLVNLEDLTLDGYKNIANLGSISVFTKLKKLDIGNEIEDLTSLKVLKNLKELRIKTVDSASNMEVIKSLNLDTLYYYQDLDNMYVDKGKNTEIELPTVVKKMLDENSPLYSEDISCSPASEVSLNESKTKLVINGVDREIGSNTGYVHGHTGNYDSETQTSKSVNVSIYLPYTIRENVTTKTEINIPDSEFKRYLLDKYDVDGDKKITNYDMLQIRDALYIDTYNYNIKDLTGLEYAKNLISFNLEREFNNMSVLEKLPNLHFLTISSLKMETIKTLNVLKKVKNLTINNYTYGDNLDYSFIGTLTNLVNLSIHDTSLNAKAVDMNSLKNLTGLYNLSITTPAELTNLTALSNLKKMTDLGLHTTNKLSDISFISNLTWLERLDLSDNNISDITPLRNLKKLTSLDLMRNPINTKESETAKTLEILRSGEEYIYINVMETNSSENIEFEDENFKKVLIENNNADLNKDNQISVEEMENLSYIYLTSEDSLKSIKEIEYAVNLYTITISSEIEDISPIAKLTRLNSINISNKAMTDRNIDVISSLSKLRFLTIRFNSNSSDLSCTVNSLEKISNMKLLQSLELSAYNYGANGNKKVFDLKGLDKLTELTRLIINGHVTNTDLIKKLPKLSYLSITDDIYKADGTKYTSKEVLDFIKSINVETYNLSINSTINIDIGNMLLNSAQKVNLANIDNELIKSVFTKGSPFYDGNAVVSYYDYSNGSSEQIKEHPITLNTKELGDRTLQVYISSAKLRGNISLKWKNYVKGNTTKEISIPDAKLKEVLLKDYDMDHNGKITEQDMINIVGLELYNEGISNLKGLENAKNLRALYAGSNYITDITPIINLTNLSDVILDNNFITNLTVLNNAKLPSLGYIDFRFNYIKFNTDTASKAALEKLLKGIKQEYYDFEEEFKSIISKQHEDNLNDIDKEVILEKALKERLIKLGVDTNKDGTITRRELRYADIVDSSEDGIDLTNLNITSISGLEYFKGYDINLSDNNISDITPITKNKFIYNLNLNNNNITNISGIEKCMDIYRLVLSNNKITDITPITNLDEMQKATDWRFMDIDLSNNQISNIDCVKNWKNIQRLDLSGNKITNVKSLQNYNFKVYDGMTEEDINNCAKDLIIDLSENKIDWTNADNKKVKEVFDKRGSYLKVTDKSKATEYVMNANGIYSADNNLGIVNTELSIRGMYEFVPEKDRTYYPGNSDKNLKGIFVNTRYYVNDQEHEAKIKARGYETEVIVTGAIRTDKALEEKGYITFVLKLPDEYVGGDAILDGEGNVTKRTRNTIGLELPVNSVEGDSTYYTINAHVTLKARNYKIKDNNNKDEILNAINNEQNVTMDMKSSVKNVDKELFENLSEKEDVELKVETSNATWKFTSDNITNAGITVNPTVTISNNKFENMDKPPFEDAIYLKFDHEGDLPGKAEIELDVSKNNIYEKGKTVYLYYFNSKTKKYEYISTLTAADKKITVTLEHCSEYVISDKLIFLPGDVNGDGKVNLIDYTKILAHVKKTKLLKESEQAPADVDNNGKINLVDYTKVLSHVKGTKLLW